MTRERKLAIQMWKEIRSILKNKPEELNTPYALIKYKEEFCAKHNLYWFSSCWFCHYIVAADKESSLFFCSTKHGTCPLYKPLHEYYPMKSPERKGCLDYFIVSNQCGEASSKYLADNGFQFKIEERIAACDRIIKTLGGEV